MLYFEVVDFGHDRFAIRIISKFC